MEKQSWQVIFTAENRAVRVPDGTSLLEAERMAGFRLQAPCGGKGICGKCRRTLQTPSGEKSVLACQTAVRQDLVVRYEDEKNAKILTEGVGRETETDSGFRMVRLTVRRILAGEADSIFERVQEAVSRAVGTETGQIAAMPETMGQMYRVLQESEYVCFALLYCEKEKTVILELSKERWQPYLFAVDIGTTTLAGYLMDADSGKVCAKVSGTNPQAAWGADVISRAGYALAHGTGTLTDTVRKAVSDLAGKAADAAGIRKDQIVLAAVAGNTCMHHLFLGISPECLVKAPYSAAVRQAEEFKAGDLIPGIHPHAVVRMLPNLAGFVGADTSACLLAAEFDRRDKMTLLIDLGTNGEMVLGNAGRRIACSTAAGPAFEGARIACGMPGADGAVDHVWLEQDSVCFSVIGKEKPIGICGSGLLDAVAALLDAGYLDDAGIFTGKNGEKEFQFLFGDGSAKETGVFLSQKDIGELQLAKASIAAGIRILCRKMGIDRKEIEEVLIAGAFGTYMNPVSACRIGLLPEVLLDRITVIGNAAGEGARLSAVSQREWERCSRIAKTTEFVELAAEEEFSDFFVDELGFPEKAVG